MAKKIIILLSLILILIFIFIGPFSKYRELSMKNKVLEDEIEYLERVNKTLAREKELLEVDPAFVEKRAREKMGVVKEGEIIYKIEDEE